MANLDEIKNNLEDTLDYSKMLSTVLGGDVGNAISQTTDKSKQLRDHLNDAMIKGTLLKVDESTFASMQGSITHSENSIESSIEFANSFTEQLKESSSLTELEGNLIDKNESLSKRQSEITQSIIPVQENKLKLLQDELASNKSLQDGLNPTSDKYQQQQSEIDKINSLISTQKGLLESVSQELVNLNEMQNYVNSVTSAVAETDNLNDAIRSAYRENLLNTQQQTESLNILRDQSGELSKLQEQYEYINKNIQPPEVKPQNIQYTSTFDTSAIENAASYVKQLQDNMLSGDIRLNIDLAGDGKVAELGTDLTAMSVAASEVENRTSDLSKSLRSVKTENEAITAIQFEQASATSTINELTQSIPGRENAVKENAELLASEQAKLDILPEGTIAHTQQLNIVKQVELTHSQQVSALKSEQAQHAELLKFRDEFLETQIETIKSSEMFGTGLNKVLQKTSDVTQESIKQQSIIEKMQDNVSNYGEQYVIATKKIAPISEALVGGVENAKNKFLDLVGSVPLVGDAIRNDLEKPFKDATSEIKSGINEGLSEMIKPLGENETITDRMTVGFLRMGDGIKKAAAILKVAFNGPLLVVGAIVGLLALAVKRFFDLESQAEEFRMGLGLSANRAKELENHAREISKESAEFGVNLEHAFDAASALTRTMGSTMLVTKEQVKLVAELSAGLGIAGDTTAGVLNTFEKINGGSADTAKTMTLMTAQLATAAGVPLDDVMNDVASASDSVLTYTRGSGKELAMAVVEARRLGTNIESIAGSMEKSLDFETSITGEMRMASILGRHISMDAMRRASFEGDTMKFTKEAEKVLRSVGDLSEMNAYQRQAVAEAMGMEVGELMKIQNNQKKIQALEQGTNAQRKMAAEYKAMQKAAEEGNEKSLAAQGEEMIRQQKSELVKQRLAVAFNKLMTELGEVLLPVVESAMNVLVPILTRLISGAGVLVKIVEFIMQPFIFIANIISAITGDTEGLKKQFDGVYATIFAIGGILLSFTSIGKKLIGNIMGLFKPLFSFIGKGFSAVFKGLPSGLQAGMTKSFSFITDGLSSLFESGLEGAKSLGSKFVDGLKKPGELIGPMKDKLGTLFESGLSGAKSLGLKLMAAFSDPLGTLKSLKEGVTGMFKSGADASKGLTDKIKNVFTAGPLKKDGTPDMRFKANKVFGGGDASVESTPGGGDGGLKDKVKGMFGGSDKATQKDLVPDVDPKKGDKFKKFLDAFNKIDMTKIVKAAAALLILSGALFVSAKAFQAFSKVSWGGVAKGILGLTALVVAAKFLEKGSTSMIKGAAAIAVLGIALLPAAFAFQMFSDVNWGGVLAGMLALGLLAVMAVILGNLIVPIAMGAAAIALLGLALIPFGIAAIMAGAGMYLIGEGLKVMVESLQMLTFEDIGKILLLGYTFAGLGLIMPIILLGAFALSALSVALIAFGVAATFASVGAFLIGTSFTLMINALKTLEVSDIANIAMLVGTFSLMGAMLPFIILGAAGLTIMGAALATFSVMALIASAGIGVLAISMAILANSFEAIGTTGVLALASLATIAVFAPMFVVAAAGMIALAGASFILGLALPSLAFGALIAGYGITMLAAGVSVLEKSLSNITTEGLTTLLSLGAIGLLAPLFFVAAGGIVALAGAIAIMSAALLGSSIMSIFSSDDPFAMYINLGKNADKLDTAAKGLRKIASSMSALSDIDAEDILDDIADGMEDLFDEIEDIEMASINKFASIGVSFGLIGDGMKEIKKGISPFKDLLTLMSDPANYEGAIVGINALTLALTDLCSVIQSLGEFELGMLGVASAEGGEDGGPSTQDMAGGANAIPMTDVVQQVASVPAAPGMLTGSGESASNAGVEDRLDELISLLKSGKLGVNLDGKKVEKQLAKAAP